MRTRNCWQRNCWQKMARWVALPVLATTWRGPALAAGCADLEPFKRAVKEAATKERVLREAVERMHDPGKTGRPKPVPKEIKDKLPDKPNWTKDDFDNAIAQARAELELGIRKTDEELDDVRTRLKAAREAQKEIFDLQEKIAALKPGSTGQADERAIKMAQEEVSKAEQKLNAESPALKANISESEQTLKSPLKSRITIPGPLGLSIGTAGEITEAMDKLGNADVAAAGLISPEITRLRVEVAVQDKIIKECKDQVEVLEANPSKAKANKEKLKKAEADKDTVEQALALVRNDARQHALGVLGQLLTAHNELIQLEQNVRKLKDDLAELQNKRNPADEYRQQIAALEKEALAKTRYSSGNVAGIVTVLAERENSLKAELRDLQGSLKEINEDDAHFQASDKLSQLREAREQAEQQLQDVLDAAKQDEAAALARAQTTARSARDVYVKEVEFRNGQLEKLRRLLPEWNAIAIRRKKLQDDLNKLRQQRGAALTQEEVDPIAAAWAPDRKRWKEFEAAGLNDSELLRREAAVPAKKREAQRQLVASLQAARRELEAFNCAEFPEAQKYLAVLNRSIQHHEQPGGEQSPGGPLTAGFMVITDLVYPPVSKKPKPRVATTPSQSNRIVADIAGSWSHSSDRIGSSTFSFTRTGNGTYDFVESGLGNARGTATLRGREVTIRWKTGAYQGVNTYTLDENYASGSGRLTWTQKPDHEQRGTTFNSTIRRR